MYTVYFPVLFQTNVLWICASTDKICRWTTNHIVKVNENKLDQNHCGRPIYCTPHTCTLVNVLNVFNFSVNCESFRNQNQFWRKNVSSCSVIKDNSFLYFEDTYIINLTVTHTVICCNDGFLFLHGEHFCLKQTA